MKKFFLLMLSVFAFCAADAQVTTSGMNGTVTDADGQPLAGATVIAVHTPSGTQYGAVSDKNGGYNLQGLRTGGPYTVTFSFVGCQSVEFPGLMLSLGQTLKRDAFLKDSQELEAVVIKADVEMGGNDQIFNLLAGRDLMRAEGMEPQVALTVPLLVLTGIAGVFLLGAWAGYRREGVWQKDGRILLRIQHGFHLHNICVFCPTPALTALQSPWAVAVRRTNLTLTFPGGIRRKVRSVRCEDISFMDL